MPATSQEPSPPPFDHQPPCGPRTSPTLARRRLLAFSHSSGVRVAEAAFLLFVIPGLWVASASLTKVNRPHIRLRFIVFASGRFRMVVARVLLACGGVLLIIATHWGHLFSWRRPRGAPAAPSA
jgi:hypothetical protein